MKIHGRILAIVLSTVMAHVAAAQTLDWEALTNLAVGTPIWVTTDKNEACLFEKAESETLYCKTIPSDDDAEGTSHVQSYRRADVRSVQVVPRRQYGKLNNSSGWFDFVFAADGGAALDARNQPNGFGVFKVGRAITLNMSLDCLSGHCGFGVENAGLIPVMRYPQFVPGKRQDFARLYLEPGVGYRFGKGPFGAYTSAGALILLRNRAGTPSPYIEYTHRFPFGSPWQGDNRVAIGIMVGDWRDSGY